MASLTLTAQIKHSSDAILAIKDINSVFALVLFGGLVDLKPELFFCHPRLNPFRSSNLGISNGGGVVEIKKAYFSTLFYSLLKHNKINLLGCFQGFISPLKAK